MEENPKPSFAQKHKNDIIDVLTVVAMIAFFARKEITDYVPTWLRDLPYLVILASLLLVRNFAKYGTFIHPSYNKWSIFNIAVIAVFFYVLVRLISGLM